MNLSMFSHLVKLLLSFYYIFKCCGFSEEEMTGWEKVNWSLSSSVSKSRSAVSGCDVDLKLLGSRPAAMSGWDFGAPGGRSENILCVEMIEITDEVDKWWQIKLVPQIFTSSLKRIIFRFLHGFMVNRFIFYIPKPCLTCCHSWLLVGVTEPKSYIYVHSSDS